MGVNIQQPFTREGRGASQANAPPVEVAPATLYIDGGQTTTFGMLYPGEVDYDLKAVQKAIMDRRLAPFYNTTEEEEIIYARALEAHGSPDSGPKMEGDASMLSVEEILGTAQINDAFKPKASGLSLAVFPLLECPICFMSYPKNFNYTRCCDQPICTDCFLQIKRPEQTFEPAPCPYCVTPHFGIVYHPVGSVGWKLKWPVQDEVAPLEGSASEQQELDITDSPLQRNSQTSAAPNNSGPDGAVELETKPEIPKYRRKSLGHKHPSVLTSDDIRPDWQQKKQKLEMERVLDQQRQALASARRRQMEAFTHAQLANFAAQVFEREASGSGGSFGRVSFRRARRDDQDDPNAGQYMQAIRYLGADVEELMLMEAMRRSMQDAVPASQTSGAEELTEEERVAIERSLADNPASSAEHPAPTSEPPQN
ncbi:SNF1-interacting protein [Kappamyces sp. JEL0829]|nr:SNF1-interacting protein [Kappamyces sp. JEL0829]